MYKSCTFVNNYCCIIYSSLREVYQLLFFSFPWTSHLEKGSAQMLRWLKLVPVSISVAFGKWYCLWLCSMLWSNFHSTRSENGCVISESISEDASHSDVCKSLIKDTEIQLSNLQMFKYITSNNCMKYSRTTLTLRCVQDFSVVNICEASCTQISAWIWLKPLSVSSTLRDSTVNLRTNPQVIGFATGSE